MSAFNMALTCVNTRAIQRLEVHCCNPPQSSQPRFTSCHFLGALQAVVSDNTRKLDSLGDKILFAERCLEDVAQWVAWIDLLGAARVVSPGCLRTSHRRQEVLVKTVSHLQQAVHGQQQLLLEQELSFRVRQLFTRAFLRSSCCFVHAAISFSHGHRSLTAITSARTP
jgi:hypothetical protein